MAGAAERAALVGDTGPSAPEKWVGGFGIGADHVLITLHAIGPDALTACTERLAVLVRERRRVPRDLASGRGGVDGLGQNGKPVPTARVHFGYTDGISMTTIRGGPERYPPDHQQPCEPWLFVRHR